MGANRVPRRPPPASADSETADELRSARAAAAIRDRERSPGALDSHAVLRLQRTAGNDVTTAVLQRRKQQRPAGAPNVGAVEPGMDVGGVAPGRAGFSSRMMVESGEMAEDLRTGGALDNLMLKHVAPDVSGVAVQERVVGRAEELWKGQKGGFNTPSTDAIYQERADGCASWLDGVAADKRQLQIHAQQFNAFVPRANSFFISSARLGSMQALLGATNNESLVAAVSAGLADAKAVAGKYKDAWEGSDTRRGPETLDVPTADDTVESQAGEVTLASKDLNDAYLGFRIAMTGQEIAAVEAEGAADRKRLAEINEVKKFVRDVGGMIDMSMSVVSGAPAAVTNVSNKLRKTEAQINAVRNKRAIMRGEKGTHNPTYLSTDDKGNMVVANAQTGMQRGADGAKTPLPESGMELPTSVEKLLGGITDFIYAGEVRDINIRLQGIANRVGAIQNWAKGAEITKAIQTFQTKLNEFAKRCNDLQQRIAARREAYLKFGVQLDRFARAHGELNQQGLGTEQGHERYATIMTVAAQIREVLAVGRNAAGGFGGDAHSFAVWAYEASERRELSSAFSHRADPMSSPPFWNVPSYKLTPGEEQAIGPIFTQLRGFDTTIAMVEKLFGPVDAAAGELLTDSRVSPGGGSGKY
jgi:hypothetical protein